jgi:hypothetical protein
MNEYEKALQIIWLLVKDKKPLTEDIIRNEIIKALPVLKTVLNTDTSDENIIETLLRQIEGRCNIWMIGQATYLDNKEEDHIIWLPDRKDEIAWKFWKRYTLYLEQEMGRAPDIISYIDKLTDDVLGRLEDPERDGQWDRRGMIVGEIQSGKTANYIGLICKAVDAGYKLIIVLAGLHNSLRSQTQLRIDEGFLGFDTQKSLAFNREKKNLLMGVGLLHNFEFHSATSLTNSAENGDFNKKVADQYGVIPGEYPIILVIKKHKSILTNLLRWALSVRGMETETGRRFVRDVPLLLIDDEADNASINTKPILDENGKPQEDYDVSVINGLIRELLNSFEQSAYVGYTATPFANIFIYPEGETDKYGEDLFPRSFIINLPVPSNYIGPSELFGLDAAPDVGIEGVEGLNFNVVTPIDDYKDIIPDKHRRDLNVKNLPESLIKAMKTFILSCAARIARGQDTAHNSMLVHVTRYVSVQEQIAELISEELSTIQQRLEYGDGNFPKKLYDELEQMWNNEFVPVTIDMMGKIDDTQIQKIEWTDIRNNLRKAASRIQIKKINGTAKDILDYRLHKNGLNVIAIGGDRLSRGLTLEGLTVSYYLRAAKMYDTLMQMGRWFGYRPGYLDLCRIFTSKELIEWYRHIAMVSKELKQEFNHMAEIGANPADYGLRVRTHPDGLLITSVNKMRSGTKMRLSYAGTISESIVFHKNTTIIKKNYDAFDRFIKSIGNYGMDNGKNYLWSNIEGKKIADLMDDIETHPDSRKASAQLLAQYIESRLIDGELVDWTVALISGGKGEKGRVGGWDVNFVIRDWLSDGNGSNGINKYTIRRLVSPTDEWLDLNEKERASVMEKTLIEWKNGKIKSSEEPTRPSGLIIRETRLKTNGLLLIYPIDPGKTEEKIPVMGFALSFPKSDLARAIEYKVNNIYWNQEFGGNDY